LLEMCKGSKLCADIKFDTIKFIDGSIKAAYNNIIPGGTKRNLSFIEKHIKFSNEIDKTKQLLLADAQTSGGLLISVPKSKEEELQAKLLDSNCNAMKIGYMKDVKSNFIEVS